MPRATLLASCVLYASALLAPPGCTNLTGWWCCEQTNVTQTGAQLFTAADYGTGVGIIDGYSISVNFTNAPAPVNGTIDAACATIKWDNEAVWTRAAPPWVGPATPVPAYARNLTAIYEVCPRAYTSPNGTGDGNGSGTFSSLTARLPYLAQLGVGAIWLAGYSLATNHFYGIWSVYAASEPDRFDPVLGSADDFMELTATARSLGIRVYLDVIGHGLVNESVYVAQNPGWFQGGSWGMTDYNYATAAASGFGDWWIATWLNYATKYNVDGYRIDIADPSWWPIWDQITLAAQAAGIEMLVFGENSRYHFSQHDVYGFVNDVVAQVEKSPPSYCYQTLQISCHDSGWESPPGNYLSVRGSRARFGYTILSPFIPLFLGGEEYNEDPVVDLPLLQQDLYGQSGKPGGWSYGSVRQFQQIGNDTSKAAMLSDSTALFGIARRYADVIHRDICTTNITRLPYAPTGALDLVPYVRFIDGAHAIAVVANTQSANVSITISVPLAAMGLGAVKLFTVTALFPSQAPVFTTAAQLQAWNVTVGPDNTPGGGLLAILLEPIA